MHITGTVVSHLLLFFHILNQLAQPVTERPRVTIKSLLFKDERSRHHVIDDSNKELLWKKKKDSLHFTREVNNNTNSKSRKMQ